MNCTIESIGPDQAQEMLNANTENFRKVDRLRVRRYSREMSIGKWIPNGDSIKFNSSGVLIDGQHRLLAVIDSGVTIQSIVVRGVINTGVHTVDRGKPRSLAQWCSHLGIKNATNVAAAARLVVMYHKGFWIRNSVAAYEVVDSEVIEFVVANSDVLQQCTMLGGRVKPIVPQSSMAAILFVGCGARDPHLSQTAMWFCESLGSGKDLSEVDAVLHLRNKVLGQGPSSKISILMRRLLLTVAWNKTVNGEECSLLRLTLTGPAKQKPPEKISQILDDEFNGQTV